MLSSPFPQQWKELLNARFGYYRRLPDTLRAEFDRQTQIFVAEKAITGIETEVTDETRLLVAASAIALSAGWPGYAWDRVSEVLIYPSGFDEGYRFDRPDRAGQADHWGVVILSAPALERSFSEREPAHHVGIHEFAHVLDLTQSRFDGIPSYLSDESIRAWEGILRNEDERLRRGDSVLHPYGLSSPPELFAVAVEAFFLMPTALATSHGELYKFLSSYFRQDPAAWEAETAREANLSRD
jgi:Mlc titration factor MtfA (ptsG expression regulator)